MDRIDPNADSRGNWTKINDSLDLHDAANRRVSQIRSDWKRRGRGNVSEGLFPFRIYLALPHQIPTSGDGDQPDPDESWRTFLVRCGRVEDKSLQGDGCDFYDDDPDSDFFPAGIGNDDQAQQITPVVVPADSVAYWFWIEIMWDEESGEWQPQLLFGENPSDNDDAVNDWETFPESDGLHIPIGYVDTTTTPGLAIIRQLLRADVLPGYVVDTCDKDNNPITLHIPGAFKEPDPPDDES